MEKVIAIIGPTAVGKTALSFSLAEHFHTELISGDAYQIYKRMDIGTAKPTAGELRRYTHHLVDIAEPDEPYSAALFCQMARKAISDVAAKGNIPILVGGTGLYVQALLEGYSFDSSGADEALRQKARERIAALSEVELKSYIMEQTEWQPADWHELLSNTNRLVRLMAAIEKGEGRQLVRAGKAEGLVYDAFVVGLSLPRSELYERIERRVDLMLEAGWPEEVKGLLEAGVSPQCQSIKAIGYEELALYAQGKMTLADAAERIKIRTRRFAKRQMTWYRRMPYIRWFEKEQYPSEEALADDVIAWIEGR